MTGEPDGELRLCLLWLRRLPPVVLARLPAPPPTLASMFDTFALVDFFGECRLAPA